MQYVFKPAEEKTLPDSYAIEKWNYYANIDLIKF